MSASAMSRRSFLLAGAATAAGWAVMNGRLPSAAQTGRWMLHCHYAFHMESGMTRLDYVT